MGLYEDLHKLESTATSEDAAIDFLQKLEKRYCNDTVLSHPQAYEFLLLPVYVARAFRGKLDGVIPDYVLNITARTQLLLGANMYALTFSATKVLNELKDDITEGVNEILTAKRNEQTKACSKFYTDRLPNLMDTTRVLDLVEQALTSVLAVADYLETFQHSNQTFSKKSFELKLKSYARQTRKIASDIRQQTSRLPKLAVLDFTQN
jgi:hypothetical protein